MKSIQEYTPADMAKVVISVVPASKEVFFDAVSKVFIKLYNTAEGDFDTQNDKWIQCCEIVGSHFNRDKFDRNLFKRFVNDVRKSKHLEPYKWREE